VWPRLRYRIVRPYPTHEMQVDMASSLAPLAA
jgi:hypothetical protein